MSQTPSQTPTNTRSTPDPDVRGGPGRFQRPEPASAAESPSWARRAGYLVALLALVVGVPAVLVWLSGPPPLPTRLPTREDLTTAIGMQQVLTVLVAVVWLAWLQFVACLVVELFSAVRGRGVPSPVPLSGPSQRLARALVGGLLLVGVVGGQVVSVLSAASDDARPAATVSAPETAGEDRTTPAASVAEAIGVTVHKAPPATSVAEQNAAAHRAGSAPGPKVYTVKAPVGHHHDNLWEIAERHLGDGRRYHEIFALNHHRPQPDGRSLHLARLIQPGWQLIMPEDAVGVARVAPPSAHGAGHAPRPAAPHEAPARHTGDGDGQRPALPDQPPELAPVLPQSGQSRAGDHASSTGVATGDVGNPGPRSPLIAALAGGGLFAAALLSALLAKRARSGNGGAVGGDALDAEVGLRVGADTERATWLDRALRGLAATCAEHGTSLPSVYAALVDEARLELLITPARTDAPEPWKVADDGRRWVLARSNAPRTAVGPAAYPALVCLGRDDDDRDVLIDLEASEGPVQIRGDAVVAHQVATALAVQLATMPWADEVRVSAYGLPEGVQALANARLTRIEDVEPVLSRLERRMTGRSGEVLTGRLSRLGGEAPEYLVLAEPVPTAVSTRLALAAGGVRQPFGIVGVGALPGAQWSLEVDETGTLNLPLLGLRLSAHRMVPRTLAAVADLFTAAATPAPTRADGRVPVPAPATESDDAAYAVADVRVGMLGPVDVRATGPIDPSRVPLAEEVVSYLALHPGGVHPGVLAAAIWPRGVSHAVATATIDRVRDWLGDDADGNTRLTIDAAGRYALAPSVAVDWDAMCQLLKRSRDASTTRTEAELLRRALRLVRGGLLEDRPSGRYSWLARTPLERTVPGVVVDAAHRLAEIADGDNDPEDGAAAARAGLRLAPTSGLLWRDLLAAEHSGHGSSGLREVVADLQETLDSHGVPVDAETEALIDHLSSTPARGAAARS